jgi:hypothetical protein
MPTAAYLELFDFQFIDFAFELIPPPTMESLWARCPRTPLDANVIPLSVRTNRKGSALSRCI